MSVKKALSILFIFVLLLYTVFSSQESLNIQNELNEHNLNWINPKTINQNDFTEIEIENKIEALIQEQKSNNILVINMEIPFNEKKLKYLGFKHPNELNLFVKKPVNSSNASELNNKIHIFKYDDFYISIENDDKINQENVYYTLRALNILKYRYKAAFNKLFQKTFSTLKSTPSFGFNYLNTNKAIWVGFNSNPKAIASNRSYLILDGYADLNKTIDLYRNISILNIHSNNILGNSNIGSKPIYNESDAYLNRIKYLKEGLLESMVHEMLHNYIDYSHSAQPKYNAIYKMRGMKSFNNFEENIVLNTSLSYFYTKGGFTNSIKDFYYTTTFNTNMNTLKRQNLFQTYYKSVFNKEPYQINLNMKMSILE